MIYGYARVSTTNQGRDGNSLEEQTTSLEKYGCQEIITEAFSGKTMERPQFQSLLGKLEDGDTLVVCKLDRFARTAIEGVQTVRELFERGVKVWPNRLLQSWPDQTLASPHVSIRLSVSASAM